MCKEDIRIARKMRTSRTSVVLANGDTTMILGQNANRLRAVLSVDADTIVGVQTTTSGLIDPVTGATLLQTVAAGGAIMFVVGWMDGVTFIPITWSGVGSPPAVLRVEDYGTVATGEIWVRNTAGVGVTMSGTEFSLEQPLEDV